MTVESPESIQIKEYVERRPYHRRIVSLANIRYQMAMKFISDNLKGCQCLDFGGGDGAMASRLASKGAKVTVFDPISIALGYAQKSDQRLGLIEGKTYLPFPEGKFKVVTMLETLEHITDEEEMIALSEVYRVLEKNGDLILSVPSDKEPVSQKHYRHYSLIEIRDNLEKTGFKIARVVPYKFLSGWWADKPVVRKLVGGFVYGLDSLIRSVNGNMGLVESSPDAATDFVILAKK